MISPKSFLRALRKLTALELALIVVTVILLIVMMWLLVHNVQLARRTGAFVERNHVTEMVRKNRNIDRMSTRDIEYVESWMTFQYVNTVFGLPDDYLRTHLGIVDPSYPKTTIAKYAKRQKLDRDSFVESLQRALRERPLTPTE